MSCEPDQKMAQKIDQKIAKDRPMTTASLKRFLEPFLENITESSVACLVTMVQGNLLAITINHWLVASQTGLLAGTFTSVVLLMWKASRPWVIALLLGGATGVVDYMVHPGQFGPAYMEALVTGLGAAALSLSTGFVFSVVRARTRRQRDGA